MWATIALLYNTKLTNVPLGSLFERLTRMSSFDDVRRIALSLPEVVEEEKACRFAVMDAEKGRTTFHKQSFVWPWMERVNPKKPRVSRFDIVVIKVADMSEKQLLLAADHDKFFPDPHYDGFPAVSVRLPEIEIDELTELITDAWRSVAPSSLLEDYEAVSPSAPHDLSL
jgi:hypothetical protein